jgi:hypothetical protein
MGSKSPSNCTQSSCLLPTDALQSAQQPRPEQGNKYRCHSAEHSLHINRSHAPRTALEFYSAGLCCRGSFWRNVAIGVIDRGSE